MKALIVLGLIGSGKDAASNYISEKYGYQIYSLGTMGIIGKAVKKEGLELTRENLQKISVKYRQKYGEDYFAKELMKEIKELMPEKLIIKEVRKPEEIQICRKEFGKDCTILRISADKKTRFNRLKKRSDERDPKTYEHFEKQENRELELYPALSMDIPDCIEIENNGTLYQLYKKIDKIMGSLK